MGYFLACTAFRDSNPEDLSEEIMRFCEINSCKSQVLDRTAANSYTERMDALIYVQDDGWIIVLWPEYFNVCDVPMVSHLSNALQVLASHVHSYDGDYWTHHLIERGTILDRFASIPSYFAESEAEAKESRRIWAGSADLISQRFGIPASIIAPYLVHLNPSGPIMGKVRREDQFELSNWWVFTDFWGHLGIRYPKDMGSFRLMVRLDSSFLESLPQTTESL